LTCLSKLHATKAESEQNHNDGANEDRERAEKESEHCGHDHVEQQRQQNGGEQSRLGDLNATAPAFFDRYQMREAPRPHSTRVRSGLRAEGMMAMLDLSDDGGELVAVPPVQAGAEYCGLAVTQAEFATSLEQLVDA